MNMSPIDLILWVIAIVIAVIGLLIVAAVIASAIKALIPPKPGPRRRGGENDGV